MTNYEWLAHKLRWVPWLYLPAILGSTWWFFATPATSVLSLPIAMLTILLYVIGVVWCVEKAFGWLGSERK